MFNKAEKNYSKQDYNQNEVYSEKMQTKRRMYYFDVKENKTNERYITLTESRKTPNGQQRNRIFIASEDLDEFISTLKTVAEQCVDQ